MGERLEGLPAREMLLLLWVQILTDGYLKKSIFGAALIDRSSTIVEHRISDYMGRPILFPPLNNVFVCFFNLVHETWLDIAQWAFGGNSWTLVHLMSVINQCRLNSAWTRPKTLKCHEQEWRVSQNRGERPLHASRVKSDWSTNEQPLVRFREIPESFASASD